MLISTEPDAPAAVRLVAAAASDPDLLAAFGGKAAQTARLVALGLPVPDAAVVTTRAYRQVLEDPGLAAVLARIRAGDDVPDDAVDQAFLAVELPAALLTEIGEVGALTAAGRPLAVRSSATVEDLGGTSFAGQYRTLLDVQPGPALVRAVALVWASLWHAAPCAYRRAHGIDDTDIAMAVLLMAMVPAVRAGVVFTEDPGGAPGSVRVEAVAGLGESLVSGAVTPSSWVLRPADRDAAPVPIGEAIRLALVAAVGFGVPLDVEWAWDGRRVWVVQARPITVAADGRADGFDTAVDDHALTTAGIAEMLPGVLPPLTWQLAGSAVEEALRTSFDALGALDPALTSPFSVVRRVRGRAALDLDALKAVAADLPGGSAELVEHGFFGGVRPEVGGARPRRWRAIRNDLRVLAARRRAVEEAGIVERAVAELGPPDPGLAALGDSSLLGRRRRLVDLGWRAMAGEIGVSAAATAAYDRLEALIARHLGPDEAPGWARRVTTGVSAPRPEAYASMSVFAGPTWTEAGVVPPQVRGTATRGTAARAELETTLQDLPRWRTTRILTGQVVDVRLHLLRRLVHDAVQLLGWRERAKGAVLAVGGQIRAIHLELGRRLVAAGALEDAADVDLLSDAELCGEAPMPAPALLARRRRAHQRQGEAGPLPERFTGRPDAVTPALPAGDRLHGLAGSGGRCTGRARVVRDPRHAKLRNGEILVAEATDAGWSPLFLQAGAIVVERGGPLSHAAIVARELGVPAVLDVHGATSVLDGRTVTVDGDDGVVVLHVDGGRP